MIVEFKSNETDWARIVTMIQKRQKDGIYEPKVGERAEYERLVRRLGISDPIGVQSQQSRMFFPIVSGRGGISGYSKGYAYVERVDDVELVSDTDCHIPENPSSLVFRRISERWFIYAWRDGAP